MQDDIGQLNKFTCQFLDYAVTVFIAIRLLEFILQCVRFFVRDYPNNIAKIIFMERHSNLKV